MKKLAAITFLVILVLGGLALPAAAQAAPDLTSLAQYFPSGSPLYVSFDTSDAMIQAVDSVIARITTAFPSSSGAPTSLRAALDQAAAQLEPGGSFDTVFRPWLGDVGAFGIYSLSSHSSQPLTIALSVTDQSQAQATLNRALITNNYDVSYNDGNVVYTPSDPAANAATFILRSDVLLITSDPALVDAGGSLNITLADDSNFSGALGLLPLTPYNGVAYVDLPGILSAMLAAQSSDFASMGTLNSTLAALKPVAAGLTLLDNHALTLDFAMPLSSGLTGMLATRATLDPTFVHHIPANAALVIQGTNLYGAVQTAADNLHTMLNSMSGSGISSQDWDTAVWAIRFAVRGLTGLELEDAFGWMTSDYALYASFSPSFEDAASLREASTSLPIDFAFTAAAPDAEAAQRLFDGLVRSLHDLPVQGVTVTQESLGDINALVFNLDLPDLPFPIELLAATGNGVFTVGTRHMVVAALDPQQGLDDNPSYVDASQYLLADSNALIYLSSDGLKPFARILTRPGTPPDQRAQGKMLQKLLDLFQSGSVSISMQPDSMIMRLVISMTQAS